MRIRGLVFKNPHDFDENGVCRDCGYSPPKLIQSVEFLNPQTLKNGDTLTASIILGPDGQPLRGKFMAEIRKVGDTEYESRVIGQG